jgi:hypothetical protein
MRKEKGKNSVVRSVTDDGHHNPKNWQSCEFVFSGASGNLPQQ